MFVRLRVVNFMDYFKSKNVFLTGASSGIGEAVAKEMARRGARVGLLARRREELERIRDEDPSSKSLVFSQYTSTLNWLKEELPKHGFQFRTLSGKMSMKQRAKALHDLQQDPPTTVFLLSMRAVSCVELGRVELMNFEACQM